MLELLNALGGNVARTDFQKLLFLYNVEVETTPRYHFVPYKYGSFSFTSYADKRKLVAGGYLEDDEKVWRLSSAGESLASQDTKSMLEKTSFCTRTPLRGTELVADTYRRYPYYATRSEIVNKVGLLSEEIGRIEKCRPPSRDAGLLTIGYEGLSLEEYLNLLLLADVTLLCDVRRNPLSRKYGFSKGALSRACESLSIRYEHLPELGIASAQRKDLNTRADYAKLFKRYASDSLPRQSEALSWIRRWILDGERVALTCYEHEANMCHRHCVADALAELDESLARVENL